MSVTALRGRALLCGLFLLLGLQHAATPEAVLAQPVPNPDAYTLDEDQQLKVDAPGVLGNDVLPGGALLYQPLVTVPPAGNLSVKADGSFTYTPLPNFHGQTSFTYVVGPRISTAETFTIDQALSTINFTGTIRLTSPISASATDSDASAISGTITADVAPNAAPFSSIHVTELNLVLANGASLSYSFGGQSSVEATVAPGGVRLTMDTPGAPAEVSNGAFTQAENLIEGTGTADLRGTGIFQNIVPSDPLQFKSRMFQDISGFISQQGSTLRLDIPVDITLTETVTYQGLTAEVDVNLTGTIVATGNVLPPNESAPTTVTLTVNPVNDAPVITSVPVLTALQGTLYEYDVTSDDADGDARSFTLDKAPPWLALTDHGDGTATLAGTPGAADVGAPKVVLLVQDPDGASGKQSFTIDVSSNNVAPVAEDDAFEIDENSVLTASAPGVLANDTDGNGDALTAELVDKPAEGNVLMEADGSFVYTPRPGFFGEDTFTYRAHDALSTSNLATVTISVAEVADADTDGVDDAVEDGAPNNGDGNGDGIKDSQQAHVTSLPDAGTGNYVTIASPEGTTLVSVSATPAPPGVPPTIDLPYGLLGFTVAGVTPGGAAVVTLYFENALPASVSYAKFGPTPDDASDHWYLFDFDGATGALQLSDRTLSLTFIDGGRGDHDLAADGRLTDPGGPALVNAGPAAADDTAETDEDTPVEFGVLANDADPEGDALTLTAVTAPAHGTAAILDAAAGTVRYTPAPDFFGDDAFTYTIEDDRGTPATATVRVTVAPVNDPPGAPTLTAPETDARVLIAGAPETPFAAEWQAAVDAEDDALTYTWQLSRSSGFEPDSLVISADVGPALTYTSDYGALGELLTSLGIGPGASSAFYHRVVVSDGAAETATTGRRVVLERGVLTGTEAGETPRAFALEGNYPNPFNPETTIRFALPAAVAAVRIEVYDALGRRVRALALGAHGAGTHGIRLEADGLPTGTYVYRLTAGPYHATGTMTLLR